MRHQDIQFTTHKQLTKKPGRKVQHLALLSESVLVQNSKMPVANTYLIICGFIDRYLFKNQTNTLDLDEYNADM